MATDWDASARAWIASQGESGDFARNHSLDAPMLARAMAQPVTRVLDVGCGEGRFCRMLFRHGIAATGIDPTAALLAQARALHPEGDYRAGRAEALDFSAGVIGRPTPKAAGQPNPHSANTGATHPNRCAVNKNPSCAPPPICLVCPRSARSPHRAPAPVAQLDRALPSEGRGHRFESCRVRQ